MTEDLITDTMYDKCPERRSQKRYRYGRCIWAEAIKVASERLKVIIAEKEKACD